MQIRRYFHDCLDRLVASQVASGSVVADVGCEDISTLKACRPKFGLGIDPHLVVPNSGCAFHLHECSLEDLSEIFFQIEPDYVILSLVLDEVDDIQTFARRVRLFCSAETRVVAVTYSRLWRPLLRLAEVFRMKRRRSGENYVPWIEVENMFALEGFEVTKRLDGILIPIYIPLLSYIANRFIAPLPVIRALSLVRVTVFRKLKTPYPTQESISIIVAARNESGHIRELVDRIPKLSDRQELIFVEGNSTDDTWQVIQEVAREAVGNLGMSIVAIQQPGTGKGDAVRAGFDIATGDILVILDADISVPPEEIDKFIAALRDDRCEFANGSRLVYPMDAKAMRFLNLVGNRLFGYLFSFLLGQPVRDTLCGTKVLRRSDYRRIAANRGVFGALDPFGDFDLLFGASYLGLRIRDIPVHYKERRYGSTNISRFSHGWLLLRMSALAAKKLKFVG